MIYDNTPSVSDVLLPEHVNKTVIPNFNTWILFIELVVEKVGHRGLTYRELKAAM